jgi:hypothetical protein
LFSVTCRGLFRRSKGFLFERYLSSDPALAQRGELGGSVPATRATGVTAYKNGGTLEKAAKMANHASTRMTQFYDRRAEEVTLDEVERILV